MEQINKVALRALAKTEDNKQLSKQLSPWVLSSLTLSMQQMQANYPNQELTPETAALWTVNWTALASEYGLNRFQSALQDLFTRCKFFPTPPEIRERIEEGIDEERQQRDLERGWARCAEVEGWRKQWLEERSAEQGLTVDEFLAAEKERERQKREAEEAERKRKRDLIVQQAKRAQQRLDEQRQQRQQDAKQAELFGSHASTDPLPGIEAAREAKENAQRQTESQKSGEEG
jgi:hypothetical protein